MFSFFPNGICDDKEKRLCLESADRQNWLSHKALQLNEKTFSEVGCDKIFRPYRSCLTSSGH